MNVMAKISGKNRCASPKTSRKLRIESHDADAINAWQTIYTANTSNKSRSNCGNSFVRR